MTTTTTVCRACRDHPVHDVTVCQPCMDQLHADLHAIPDVVRDLLTELAGQARKAAPGVMVTAHSHEQPFPVNLAASRALAALRFTLVAACLSVANNQRDRLPPDRIGAMTDWLIHYEASIGLRENGGDICRGITAAIKRARGVCDSPPERRYIGDCDCTDAKGEPTRLYARMGEPVYACRECGTEWLVAERFAQLERELADYGLTHRELETLLPTIPRATLFRWIAGDEKRGQPPRVKPQGTTAEGEPVYRYGDVLALDARRRERRKSA